jgi:transcriptional regulator with XRE-family HTH domain
MEGMVESLFRAWRESLGLTQNEAAEALGRSRRQIQNYDTGAEAPPRVVRLAMIALEEHLELATYKFADGSEVPDDEVMIDPNVADQYSPESEDRLTALRDKLNAAKTEAEDGETSPPAGD